MLCCFDIRYFVQLSKHWQVKLQYICDVGIAKIAKEFKKGCVFEIILDIDSSFWRCQI